MALPITFNNTVFQAGFFGTDDGGAPASGTFQVDDVYDFPVTLNGTVTGAGSTVTLSYTLPGSTTPTTQTLTATNLDNANMILFTGGAVPGSTGAGTNRFLFSNTQMYGSPPPAGQTRTRFTADGNGTVGDYVAPVCFVTGTKILTDRGQVSVEDLKIGDFAVTASGSQLPIRWIGHRLVNAADCINPRDVWPVRIIASAISMNVPSRDLLVSPDHCLVFDDVLVPAKHLINGATILQEPVEAVGYWHIELDTHEALLAEGTPAESYRDCGMHAFFEGAEGWGTRIGDKAPAALLAPHALSGPRLHGVKEILIARAKHLGAQREESPKIQIVADGRVLTPTSIESRHFGFEVPEGTRELVLRSRSTVAAHWIADNEDPRTLGVRVSKLRIDGAEIEMTDSRLSQGWNAAELSGQERWTDGHAYLPVCRHLSFSADWFLGYPVVVASRPLPANAAVSFAAPLLRLVANG